MPPAPRPRQPGGPLVACATTYALLKKDSRSTAFDLVVIDEASQLRLPEAMLAVHRVKPRGRLLLCGDDQQLGTIFRGTYPEPRTTGASTRPPRCSRTRSMPSDRITRG